MDEEPASPTISPPPQMDPTATTSTFLGDPAAASSLFDWSEFLDFDLIDPFAAVAEAAPPPPPLPETTVGTEEDPSRVRKRDPMLVCPNFLAGRIPCACPELDAQLAQEEEMALAGPGKKRALTTAGSGARCQVPGCEVDISELKGYHKRHRVCLRCATASVVQLDGESKRYCQQCGKFHIISDFDEGRRSCRRKLERHNTRRRRKPHDGKGGVEKKHKQITLIEDVSGDDDVVKEDTSLSNENVEKETFLESEGQLSNPSSVHVSHEAQNNGPVTFATSSETQTNREKENQNSSQSPSYCDNKTTFSSMCPTGRISFKLYDWNPAEFPRRLRHQIFQWLANMPVELEGYIRPGCTIFTVFIAMPKSMWSKLSEDPATYLPGLVDSPGSMLHGRDTFFVYLENMIFKVLKGGNSAFKLKVNVRVPKLHYVTPAFVEAGKPMEFVACGSDLLQSKLRFLVSFGGKYLSPDIYAFPSSGDIEGDSSRMNHQSLKVSVPQTEPDHFGPAFFEVENESGISNFIPILIGDKEICDELKIIQQRLDTCMFGKGSEPSTTSSSCEVSVLNQTNFTEFLMDVAWSLRKPLMENMQFYTSSQIQRLDNLLNFLMENDSTAILDKVVYHAETMMDDNIAASDIATTEMETFCTNLDKARTLLNQKLREKGLSVNYSRKPEPKRNTGQDSLRLPTFAPSDNQGMEKRTESKLAGMSSASLEGCATVPLLYGDVVMSVNSGDQHRPTKSCTPRCARTLFSSRYLVFAATTATVCFGLCAILLHPDKVSEVAITIRKSLLEKT